MVPPKGRTQCGKTHWKPSIPESRDGLFIHIKSPGDLETEKQKRIDFAYRKGLTIQPYIVLIGPSLNNIISSSIIVNNNIYKVHSVLEALDLCFRIIHVLDADYPFQSQHLWYLIQWHMYKIHTPSDKKITFLSDLV